MTHAVKPRAPRAVMSNARAGHRARHRASSVARPSTAPSSMSPMPDRVLVPAALTPRTCPRPRPCNRIHHLTTSNPSSDDAPSPALAPHALPQAQAARMMTKSVLFRFHSVTLDRKAYYICMNLTLTSLPLATSRHEMMESVSLALVFFVFSPRKHILCVSFFSCLISAASKAGGGNKKEMAQRSMQGALQRMGAPKKRGRLWCRASPSRPERAMRQHNTRL